MRTQCSAGRRGGKGGSAEQLTLHFADAPTPITVNTDADHLSSDGGLLALGAVEERFGLIDLLASVLSDGRDQSLVVHPLRRLLREAVFACAGGYVDANDHTPLRDDPLAKALVGPVVKDSPNPKKQEGLASEATLSRLLSNRRVSGFSEAAVAHVAGFVRVLGRTTPSVLTLDIDGFGVETHGQQQLALFNGHLGHEGYYPLLVTVDEYGMALGARLRPGNAGAAAEALELLAPIVTLLQQALPDTTLRLRADAGFASPEIFEFAESRNMQYCVRLRLNSVLKDAFSWLLPALPPDDPCRRQEEITDYVYQAKSWSKPRRIVMKLVWNEKTHGYERYVLVTNLTRSAEKVWSIYHHRGRHEQRIGELMHGLDLKLSCCCLHANAAKLQLLVTAHNLHAALRAVLPPTHPLKRATLGRLIRDVVRCAAQVRQTVRRLWVRLSATTPNTAHLLDVLRLLQKPRLRASPLWGSG